MWLCPRLGPASQAIARERLLPHQFHLCDFAFDFVNVYFHWNFIYVIMPSMGSSASQAIVRECVLPQELHLCGHALDGLRCFSGHYSWTSTSTGISST